jgi:type II secretory ATPase GspE/PulE/Tfp pilus assembly ATPase PilB-like protein
VFAYLKGELAEEEKRGFEEALSHGASLRAELEQSRELLALLDVANEQTIVRLVHVTIRKAIECGATDIHLVPGSDRMMVSFRVDGQLQEVMRLSRAVCQPTIDRWKLMSDCSLLERKLPQQGRVRLTWDEKEYDARVTVVPTAAGERVTVRLRDRSRVLAGLGELGFSPASLAAVQRLARQPAGFVAAAGPAGSGRTTLLYSMLLETRAEGGEQSSIMTIEDPIEYLFEEFSQTALRPEVGLTYAAAIRAVAQSDPDAVLVGALRDRESAERALELAVTGRRVLAALVASSALGVVQNLRAMGVEPFLLAQSLAGAVGQRLVRQICPACVRDYLPSPAALETLGLSPDEDGPFRRGAGCEACRQTGYQGRIGLFEVLEVDDAVRRMIVEDAPIETLRRETFGRTGGSLWDDGREKARQGLTTVEEVTRVLFDYPQPALEPRVLDIRP